VDTLQGLERGVPIAVVVREFVGEELIPELEEQRLVVVLGVDVFLGDREMVAVFVDLGGCQELFEELTFTEGVGVIEETVKLRRRGRSAVGPGNWRRRRRGIAARSEGAREEEDNREAGGKTARHGRTLDAGAGPASADQSHLA